MYMHTYYLYALIRDLHCSNMLYTKMVMKLSLQFGVCVYDRVAILLLSRA